MRLAVKTLKKMKLDGTKMLFASLGHTQDWVLQGFGDAGFKSLPDKVSSCCGYVILLSNRKTGVTSVLDWKSLRILGSSTAAEALAANDTLDALVYASHVLRELLGANVKDIPIELTTDCKNLHNSVHTSTLVENPRLRIDISKLKESLENKELRAFWYIAGKKMIANVLTKKGAEGVGLMSVLRHCKF